jgi:uncharacterized protein
LLFSGCISCEIYALDVPFFTKFEFDTAKSNDNEQRRGFGFEYAARVFFDEHRVEVLDDRHDYGEARVRVIGAIEGNIFAVVYTIRGDAIRIISARKANRYERRRYQDRHP